MHVQVRSLGDYTVLQARPRLHIDLNWSFIVGGLGSKSTTLFVSSVGGYGLMVFGAHFVGLPCQDTVVRALAACDAMREIVTNPTTYPALVSTHY